MHMGSGLDASAGREELPSLRKQDVFEKSLLRIDFRPARMALYG